MKSYVIQESIRHQVLCKLTAFICVEQKMIDGRYQDYKDSTLTKIVVPQYESVDY
jgi:hypothetical protein